MNGNANTEYIVFKAKKERIKKNESEINRQIVGIFIGVICLLICVAVYFSEQDYGISYDTRQMLEYVKWFSLLIGLLEVVFSPVALIGAYDVKRKLSKTYLCVFYDHIEGISENEFFSVSFDDLVDVKAKDNFFMGNNITVESKTVTYECFEIENQQEAAETIRRQKLVYEQAKNQAVLEQQQKPVIEEYSEKVDVYEVKYCLYCGRRLPEEAQFCNFCGKKQIYIENR